MSSLEKLNFGANDSMDSILTTLLSGIPLNSVKFENVAFTDEQISIIAQKVLNDKTLSELTFKSCNISEKGLIMIAKELKDNTNLEKIEFIFNNLSATAVNELADSLESNSTLSSLLLAHNSGISTEPYKKLIEAVEKSKTLKVLDLSFSLVDALDCDNIKALKKMIGSTTTLKSLILGHIIFPSILQDLGCALKDNYTITQFGARSGYESVDNQIKKLVERNQISEQNREASLTGLLLRHLEFRK